jgi:hypothetical protein
MSDPIVLGLVRAGWVERPPRPGATARVEHARGDGSRIVVEARADNLWFVIDEPADRRVLGLEPSSPPDEVVAAIVALADTASLDDYFSAYGDLGAVGSVAIIAWEQFDPDWQ